MNEEQKRKALVALADLVILVATDQVIEFSLQYMLEDGELQGAVRHKGGHAHISQGLLRFYGKEPG